MVSKLKMMEAYKQMEIILKACRSDYTNEEYNGIIDKAVTDYACFEE